MLGLHLLGFGLLGSQASSSAAARSAALARNSTTPSSSLLSPSGASSNSVYRHPILYDKLTGATNNQISEVLGQTKPLADQFPIDHYQQQQAQPRQQKQPSQNPFEFGANQDIDPFANLPGRPTFAPSSQHPTRPGLIPPPPPPPPHHPQLVPSHAHPSLLGHHHRTHHPHSHLPPTHQNLITTQAPAPSQAQQDSLPSASSVANNGATRPLNATNQPQQQQQQLEQLPQQPQQPLYYTPPIFTYSNNQNPYEPNQQQHSPLGPYQGQLPPMGVPEVPFSVDEYNARQARLQQQQQQRPQQPLNQEVQKQQVNLLADPQAQQRHKQQMLDRQFILGAGPASYNEHPQYFAGSPPLQEGLQPNMNNFSTAAYYPDPALYNRLVASQHQQQQQPPQQMLQRAPYAHPMSNQLVATQLEAPTAQLMNQQLKQLAPPNHNALNSPPSLPPPPPQRTAQSGSPSAAPPRPSSGQQQTAPIASSSIVRNQQPAQQLLSRQSQAPDSMPTCARQQRTPAQVTSLELANTTSQMPVLFCNEDSEYPTPDIMRALENFAIDRSIEQILPQQLVQMLVQTASSANNNQRLADLQRQLSLDSLQPNVNAQSATPSAASSGKMSSEEQLTNNLFPSSNYEPMCKAAIWMSQPRRARNLLGQWKVIVNLPGHKYRGIAISQMVRIEECSRPNSECASPAPQLGSASSTTPASTASAPKQLVPRSRCLQQYENQRLLSWSHQQGLHFDIFRMPSACSCHMRLF